MNKPAQAQPPVGATDGNPDSLPGDSLPDDTLRSVTGGDCTPTDWPPRLTVNRFGTRWRPC